MYLHKVKSFIADSVKAKQTTFSKEKYIICFEHFFGQFLLAKLHYDYPRFFIYLVTNIISDEQ